MEPEWCLLYMPAETIEQWWPNTGQYPRRELKNLIEKQFEAVMLVHWRNDNDFIFVLDRRPSLSGKFKLGKFELKWYIKNYLSSVPH